MLTLTFVDHGTETPCEQIPPDAKPTSYRTPGADGENATERRQRDTHAALRARRADVP